MAGLGFGFALGALGRLAVELLRYAAWGHLEADVEAWKESPRGRMHSWLDGLQ